MSELTIPTHDVRVHGAPFDLVVLVANGADGDDVVIELAQLDGPEPRLAPRTEIAPVAGGGEGAAVFLDVVLRGVGIVKLRASTTGASVVKAFTVKAAP